MCAFIIRLAPSRRPFRTSRLSNDVRRSHFLRWCRWHARRRQGARRAPPGRRDPRAGCAGAPRQGCVQRPGQDRGRHGVPEGAPPEVQEARQQEQEVRRARRGEQRQDR